MDARDSAKANGHWYDSFDAKRMIVTVKLFNPDCVEFDEEYDAEFPVKFEVCELCHGSGKHVNPSIDAHGISTEEFDEDPDFAEDYMSGAYDVTCYECGGRNVVPEIDEAALTTDKLKEDYKRLQEYLEELAQSRAQDAYCARMGF